MITTDNINTSIKEINDFLKAEIIAGRCEVKEINPYSTELVTVTVCGVSVQFYVKDKSVSPTSGDFRVSFDKTEEAAVRKALAVKITEYKRAKLMKQRAEIDAKLAELDESAAA